MSGLLEGGQCSVSDIAVVTPYAAQAQLIRHMTKRMTSITGPPYIEVSSVDGFQGWRKKQWCFWLFVVMTMVPLDSLQTGDA